MAHGLTSAAFWIDTAERTIRTFAQTTLASFGVVKVTTDLAAWSAALEIGGATAGFCLLTCLSTIGIANSDPLTASFLPVPQKTPQALRSMLRLRPQ